MKVTVICGGRGAATIITALLNRGHEVSAVVNAYDDGRSTGWIRKMLNILGPSDIRKVQELGMPNNVSDEIKQLMASRVTVGSFAEIYNHVDGLCKTPNVHRWGTLAIDELVARHSEIPIALKDTLSIANVVYAGCILDSCNDISVASQRMGIELSSTIDVVPSSNDVLWLAAIGEDGREYLDEASIVDERSVRRISRLILHNDVRLVGECSNLSKLHSMTPRLSSRAYWAIKSADAVVVAPGTVHSSIYPTLMHRGIADAAKCSGRVFIVTNAAADADTPGYTAEDYVRTITQVYGLSHDTTVALCAADGETEVNAHRVKHWCSKLIHENLLDANGKHDGHKIASFIEQII